MRAPLLLLIVLASGLACSHPQSTLTRCRSNLKNVATALEMYSTDNSGRYPFKLAQLCPNYLVRIPECPAAGKDTYTQTYARAEAVDQYAVYCSGSHHALAPNLPAYDSHLGLLDRYNASDKAGCEKTIRTLVQQLEIHHQKNGRYPQQLADLKITVPTCPSNGSATYQYQRRGKSYQLACGGPTAHMAEGLQPFQPTYTPKTGLAAKPLPLSPPRPAEATEPNATSRVIAACALISALLALLAMTTRRES